MAIDYSKLKGVEGLLTEEQYRVLPDGNKAMLEQLERLPQSISSEYQIAFKVLYSGLMKTLYEGAVVMDPARAQVMASRLELVADSFRRQAVSDTAVLRELLDGFQSSIERIHALVSKDAETQNVSFS